MFYVREAGESPFETIFIRYCTLPSPESVLVGSFPGAPWPDNMSDRDNEEAINWRRSSKFK